MNRSDARNWGAQTLLLDCMLFFGLKVRWLCEAATTDCAPAGCTKAWPPRKGKKQNNWQMWDLNPSLVVEILMHYHNTTILIVKKFGIISFIL
jgi:hypothetical protein